MYIKSSLLRSADDPRKFWKSINNLLKGQKKEIITHEFIINSTTGKVISQNNVCDYLNNYYVNIGAANITVETQKPNWLRQDAGYYFEPVTRREVLDLIKGIAIGN